MATLIVLVGVRGAGKTTTQERLGRDYGMTVLVPSTTRPARGEWDVEYDFHTLDSWGEVDLAWSISIGKEKYGMRASEISSLKSGLGVTVFHPPHLDVLREFSAKNKNIRVVTVGLDTVDSPEAVVARTGGDHSRAMTDREFNIQREVVRNCDVVLSGEADVVVDAVFSVADLFQQRGGVLPDATLRRLLRAGALLNSFHDSNISPASYDLRLGDDVWCQGKFESLSEKNPTLSIPPYSYAVVSALEVARMPRFLVGRFDLKVSLFFQGVVLSNGPQVDPGYRGALFCMLYNGSDTPVGITRGSHFATLEFVSTAGLSSGYSRQYQDKQRLSDFIPGHAAVSKGGQILERFLEQDKSLKNELTLLRTVIVAMASLIVAMVAISAVAYWNVRGDAQKAVDHAHAIIERLEDAEKRQADLLESSVSQRSANSSKSEGGNKVLSPSQSIPPQTEKKAGKP